MKPFLSPLHAPPVAAYLKRLTLLTGFLFVLYGILWFKDIRVDIGLANYVPLHLAMETAAIVAATLVFGIAWNAHAESRPGSVIFLGVVLLGSALLDFAHMLGSGGMPDFVTPESPQKAITFWFAARFLVAIGLLIVAFRPWQPVLSRRGRYLALALVLAYVAAIYISELFFPEAVPHFFIRGSGMTPLKIWIEYSLVLMYSIAAVALYRKARLEAGFNRADLFAAASITCLSELCATLYGSVGDTFNIAAHVFKILSFSLIFRAVFIDSVRQPFRDLNAALLKERQYAAEQHSLVRTLDMLEEGVVELSPGGVITHANAGWWRLADTLSANDSLDESIQPQDRPAFLKCLEHLQSGQKDEFHGRFRFIADAGHERWMDCRFLAERNDWGQILGIRGVLRDITKTYLQERHIAHMAHHDALTGLPNRILLEDRISKAIQSAKRHNEIVAVCFVDLDHFKNINDAYGHKTGDGLLREVSSALASCLAEGDTVARWGGDEFVVLFPCVADLDAAREAARRLVSVMGQSFKSNGQCVNATFSVGVSLYPIDADNVDALLTHADRAMFYAKSQGRNNFQLFSDMTERGLGKKELYIQARLAQAIRDERIMVWFQPQVNTRSVASGEHHHLKGVEALARWKDDDFGWIPPSSFVPMAENLGLIGELGRLVRRKALAQFRQWMADRPGLHLSLNISKRQLVGPDFCSSMIEDCVTFGVPANRLVLEVTESIALMEVEGADDQLHRLVGAGFTLSIDDFGTGYASLSQLHALPVGELKIDISFVRRAHTPDGLRILQAIVQLAKALSFRTVAEGVEDEATSVLLNELNVDIQQGYYFGRPCAGEEFAERFFFVASSDPVLNRPPVKDER